MPQKVENRVGSTHLKCPDCNTFNMTSYRYCKKCGHDEGVPP